MLDAIFQRILLDGERTRAERDPGPPPWTPEPQTDPRYEHLDPEAWHTVPYPPEQWIEEWRDALVTNRQEGVRPLVTDALLASNLALADDTPEWRGLCRLALVVAAQAHAINARREWGNYCDGWPQSAGVPPAELPGGDRGADAAAAPASSSPASGAPADSTPAPSRHAPSDLPPRTLAHLTFNSIAYARDPVQVLVGHQQPPGVIARAERDHSRAWR